jgi:hypothetical protein
MPVISFDYDQTVLLFIKDWIPPHIQYSASKVTPSQEKAAQIESAAILRDKDIHRLRLIATDRRARCRVCQVGCGIGRYFDKRYCQDERKFACLENETAP